MNLKKFNAAQIERLTGIILEDVDVILQSLPDCVHNSTSGQYVFNDESEGNAGLLLYRLYSEIPAEEKNYCSDRSSIGTLLDYVRVLVQEAILPGAARETVLRSKRYLDLIRSKIEPLKAEDSKTVRRWKSEFVGLQLALDEAENSPRSNLNARWKTLLEMVPSSSGGKSQQNQYLLSSFLHRGIWSYKIRPFYNGESACYGRDHTINDLVQRVNSNDPHFCYIYGVAGIGKSTLLQAVAKNITHSARTYDVSNIQVFDCSQCGTLDDISLLLFSQTSGWSLDPPPETSMERFAAIKSRVAGQQNRHLWLIDNLDRLSRHEESALYLHSLYTWIESLGRVSTLMAARMELADWRGELSDKEEFPINALKIEGIGAAQPIRCSSSDPDEIQKTLSRHPLANLLFQTAFERNQQPDVLKNLKFKSTTESDLLRFAVEYSFACLNEVQREVLAVCALLPAGMWFSGDEPLDYDPIRWRSLFSNIELSTVLTELCSYELVMLSSDQMGRTTYLLRPAIQNSVVGLVEQHTLLRLKWKLVLFWQRRLADWNKIMTSRSFEHGKIVLPIAEKSKDLELGLEQKYAYFLTDLSMRNWQQAFEYIGEVREDSRMAVAYWGFLRNTICYARMTGTQVQFMEMLDKALVRLVPWHGSLKLQRLSGYNDTYRVLYASCLGMKGRTHRRLGNWSDAVIYYKDALESLGELPPSKSVLHERAWALTELGRVHHTIGDWTAASEFLQQAVSIRENLLAGAIKSAHTSDDSRSKTVGIYIDSADQPSNISVTREERFLASSLVAFGALKTSLMDYQSAESMFRKALRVRQILSNGNRFYFQRYEADCYNYLGSALYYQNKLKEAIDCYRRALQIREDIPPEYERELNHYIARTWNNLGNAYRRIGDWNSAKNYLERARNAHGQSVYECSSRFQRFLASTLCNLGRVYLHQGFHDEARLVLEESYRVHSGCVQYQSVSFEWVECCIFLSLAYLRLPFFDRIEKSTAVLVKGFELIDSYSSPAHEKSACYYRALAKSAKAKLLLEQHDFSAVKDEVFLLLTDSLELKSSLLNQIDSPEILHLHLAETYLELGKLCCVSEPEVAMKYLEEGRVYAPSLRNSQRLYARQVLVRILLQIARLKCAEFDYSSTNGCLDEAERIIKEVGNRNFLIIEPELSSLLHLREKLRAIQESEGILAAA